MPRKIYNVYRGFGAMSAASDRTATNHPDYNLGRGTYFTKNPAYAKLFGKVRKTRFMAKNPLVISSFDALFKIRLKSLRAGFSSIGAWARQRKYDVIEDVESETIVRLPKK